MGCNSKAIYAARFLCLWLCCLEHVHGQERIFTEADRAALVSLETAQQKWTQVFSRTKDLANNGGKVLLSNLMDSGSTGLNISYPCIRDGMKILFGIRKLKPWAVKFLDSTAKMIDGVLGVTTASFGCYDECVNNVVMDDHSKELFRGKYCVVNIKPYLPKRESVSHPIKMKTLLSNVSYEGTIFETIEDYVHLVYYGSWRLGVCIPSSCSKDDLNQLLEKAGDYMGLVVKIKKCEIKEKTKITPIMIGAMTAYSFCGFMVLLGTLISVFCYYAGKKLHGTCFQVLTSFSCIRNFQILTRFSQEPRMLNCFDGMRFLTMGWVILNHTYIIHGAFQHHLPEDVKDKLGAVEFQVVANGFFSVDTFFFMTAVLVCYHLTKQVIIGKGKFNVPFYILHRLCRVMPVYVFTILYTFLLPLTISGPLSHDTTDHLIYACEKNWWSTLLFINTFYDIKNKCVPHGWYLSVDMQLCIFSLIILLPLIRSAKWGIGIALTFTVASMMSSGINIIIRALPSALSLNIDIEKGYEYILNEYNWPHSHIATYCIGIMTGYLLAVKPDLKIPRMVQVLGWCTAIMLCMSSLYGSHSWLNEDSPGFWAGIFYGSCSRTAWSLGIAWMVVCCCTGHAEIINYILSWKVWTVLGRLTFVAYLSHWYVMTLYNENLRSAVLIPHHYQIVWVFVAHLVITYAVSFVGFVLVEAPFTSLEKIILFRQKTNADPKHAENGYADPKDVKNGYADPKDPRNGYADPEENQKTIFSVITSNGTSETSCGVVNIAYMQKTKM